MRLKETLKYNFKVIFAKLALFSAIFYITIFAVICLLAYLYEHFDIKAMLGQSQLVLSGLFSTLSILLVIIVCINIYTENLRISLSTGISRKTSIITTTICTLIFTVFISILSILFEIFAEYWFEDVINLKSSNYIYGGIYNLIKTYIDNNAPTINCFYDFLFMFLISILIISVIYLGYSLIGFLGKKQILVCGGIFVLCFIIANSIYKMNKLKKFDHDVLLIIGIIYLVLSLITFTIHFIFYRKLDINKSIIIK